MIAIIAGACWSWRTPSIIVQGRDSDVASYIVRGRASALASFRSHELNTCAPSMSKVKPGWRK